MVNFRVLVVGVMHEQNVHPVHPQTFKAVLETLHHTISAVVKVDRTIWTHDAADFGLYDYLVAWNAPERGPEPPLCLSGAVERSRVEETNTVLIGSSYRFKGFIIIEMFVKIANWSRAHAQPRNLEFGIADLGVLNGVRCHLVSPSGGESPRRFAREVCNLVGCGLNRVPEAPSLRTCKRIRSAANCLWGRTRLILKLAIA